MNLKVVKLDLNQADVLRVLLLTHWDAAIYNHIRKNTGSNPLMTTSKVINENQFFCDLINPIELLLSKMPENVEGYGALVLAPSLYEKYVKTIATDLLPADVPEMTEEEYSYMTSATPIINEVRLAFKQATEMSLSSFKQDAVPNQASDSGYKN